MFKTVDGGANWTSITSSNMIFKICFSDNNNGYALTVDSTGAGDIIKSTNAGDNWTLESTPKSNLRGISFFNTNLGFAVGDSGVILRYSITNNIEEIISYDNIMLNPNPASDIFNLNFNNKNNDCFSLNIYNVTGNLVKSVILEQNNQQVNIRDLNNGVYIVTIKSEDMIKSQKLIIQR